MKRARQYTYLWRENENRGKEAQIRKREKWDKDTWTKIHKLISELLIVLDSKIKMRIDQVGRLQRHWKNTECIDREEWSS